MISFWCFDWSTNWWYSWEKRDFFFSQMTLRIIDFQVGSWLGTQTNSFSDSEHISKWFVNKIFAIYLTEKFILDLTQNLINFLIQKKNQNHFSLTIRPLIISLSYIQSSIVWKKTFKLLWCDVCTLRIEKRRFWHFLCSQCWRYPNSYLKFIDRKRHLSDWKPIPMRFISASLLCCALILLFDFLFCAPIYVGIPSVRHNSIDIWRPSGSRPLVQRRWGLSLSLTFI